MVHNAKRAANSAISAPPPSPIPWIIVQMLRSVSFLVAFIALIVMLGAGLTAALR